MTFRLTATAYFLHYSRKVFKAVPPLLRLVLFLFPDWCCPIWTAHYPSSIQRVSPCYDCSLRSPTPGAFAGLTDFPQNEEHLIRQSLNLSAPVSGLLQFLPLPLMPCPDWLCSHVSGRKLVNLRFAHFEQGTV